MSLRINTATQFEQSILNLQKRQRDLLTVQDKLTSGKRVSAASDDPTAAAVAERALATQMRIDVSQRALQASRNVVMQTESALGDANDLLQRFRELTVQLGNGTYGASDRDAMTNELIGIRDQLIQVANRSDGAGNYLFSGQGSTQAPFAESLVAGVPTVTYQGTTGYLQSATTEGLPISVDGYSAWMLSREGSDTVERSVFDALDGVLAAASGNPTVDGFGADIANGLDELDAAMSNLSAVRAKLGGMLNQADGIEQRLAQAKVAAQAEQSGAEDLDLVQAVSDFQNRQTSYDAALRAYSMVQKLSLFDYLR